MQGKQSVHLLVLQLVLPTDCCALFCVPPAPRPAATAAALPDEAQQDGAGAR
ncbi:hypothetical protein PR001_g9588 [Phytophthora rubi]|uniref:RxLR effector protein n=1 Tax=Phytophthora rubi TaxID=129364 RepID=A0A6A3MNZ6_9STRA|nr:hypothetical protein PR001_g9588 [Phytophthora rubi]